MLRSFLLATVSLLLCSHPAPADPSPSDAKPLFAADSLAGWLAPDGTPAKPGPWVMENGVLTRMDKGGDLWSEAAYGDFELSFDWQVTTGANSGVKYRVLKQKNNSALGFEYQVLDDAVHADGKKPTTSAAALYHVIAPDTAKALKPVGEWNHARVIIRGHHVEHWLNDQKVVDVTTEGPDWDAAVAKSKYARDKSYGTATKGPIVIQDHGDKVSFRNMVIKEL